MPGVEGGGLERDVRRQVLLEDALADADQRGRVGDVREVAEAQRDRLGGGGGRRLGRAAAPVVPAAVEAVSVLAVVSDDDFESLPHAPSTASAARPSAARGMPRRRRRRGGFSDSVMSIDFMNNRARGKAGPVRMLAGPSRARTPSARGGLHTGRGDRPAAAPSRAPRAGLRPPGRLSRMCPEPGRSMTSSEGVTDVPGARAARAGPASESARWLSERRGRWRPRRPARSPPPPCPTCSAARAGRTPSPAGRPARRGGRGPAAACR